MIEIINLKKSFEEKQVLNDISLKINVGETLCIIGKSGCGKSVWLKHIVGLLYPDDGYVKINGDIISDMNQKDLFDVRRRIGYVFQGAALFDSYNVFENVVLKLMENGEKDINKLINEAKFVLSSVGLLPSIEDTDSAFFEKE
jgi:phospholipid/cholesterol/gamma-HCH transport system ATP-binding protein